MKESITVLASFTLVALGFVASVQHITQLLATVRF